jgi:hypothetical protein
MLWNLLVASMKSFAVIRFALIFQDIMVMDGILIAG